MSARAQSRLEPVRRRVAAAKRFLAAAAAAAFAAAFVVTGHSHAGQSEQTGSTASTASTSSTDESTGDDFGWNSATIAPSSDAAPETQTNVS